MSWLLSLDPIFHQDEVTKTQSGVLFSPTLDAKATLPLE